MPEAARRFAKAERFLAQAADQSPHHAPEATIHLSYYAMLHAAAAVLVALTGRAPKTHGAVIGQFAQLTQNDNDRGRILGRAFNKAEDTRLFADYDDRAIPSEADASHIRETAVDFVAYCRSLL